MTSLTVWRFTAAPDAEHALPRLQHALADGAAVVDDAALVTWALGLRKPSTRGLGSVTGPGTFWGGFWGLLLGLIFLSPMAGPTFGAAAGAVAAGLSDFGVEDDFVLHVRETVTPGTSAIFVVSSDAAAERLAAALSGLPVATLRSTLSPAQERQLRDALGEDSLPPS